MRQRLNPQCMAYTSPSSQPLDSVQSTEPAPACINVALPMHSESTAVAPHRRKCVEAPR